MIGCWRGEKMQSCIAILAAVFFVGCFGISCVTACPSADMTGDCHVDFADFTAFANQWLCEKLSYDIAPGTGDGIVNFLDWAMFAEIWQGDMAQLAEFADQWLKLSVDSTADIAPVPDGDGIVNMLDFAVLAEQWLEVDVPIPTELVWVSINDSGVSGHEGFSGQMSKYETTNDQYCQFLNAALATGDITVSDNIVYGASGSNSGSDYAGKPYFRTEASSSDSQITYSGGTFSVRSRNERSMADHPVIMVSWYGAAAFCNYYGYRLPTEWEWQAVADYDGSYIYGCETTINQSKANYYDETNGYANPVHLTDYPYTSPVNYYPSYGYGMNDMAGNVWEWTSSPYNNVYRVIRGGSWSSSNDNCAVAYSSHVIPLAMYNYVGFRACR
jgi:hypothetical protein